MKQIKLHIPTMGSVSQYDNISRMIEEFNELGVYNNIQCCIEYDENNIELNAMVNEIFAKYNYKRY